MVQPLESRRRSGEKEGEPLNKDSYVQDELCDEGDYTRESYRALYGLVHETKCTRVPQCVLAGCIIDDMDEAIPCFNGYRTESEALRFRGFLYRSQILPRSSVTAGYSTLAD